METEKLLYFGIPIDRLDQSKLETVFADLITQYALDRRPRFGTTVNALVLGLASGWPFFPKDPETIQRLRSSDFIGLDSPFLISFAKMLGAEIPKVTSDDLLVSGATFCAKYGKKLFLIGGDEEQCKQVANALKHDHPSLNVVGWMAPHIKTKGPQIVESIENDTSILKKINEAKPDLLLIQLGHPKQDLWFGRIASQLNVPLSLGVGGAFERFIAQRKFANQPSSSFSPEALKRKLKTAWRFFLWAPSLFFYNTVNRLLYDLIYKRFRQPPQRRSLFLSEKEALSVIPFPTLVNARTWSKKPDWLEEALEHDHVILDLSKVRHLDLIGLGMLFQIKKNTENASKNLMLLGVSSELKAFFKVHGAWDLFSSLCCSDSEAVLARVSYLKKYTDGEQHDFVSIHQIPNQTIISLFGKLNSIEDGNHRILNVDRLIDGKDCAIDLNYCTGISNRGFGFLLKLRERQIENGNRLVVTDASRQIRHQFKNRKLQHLFNFS